MKGQQTNFTQACLASLVRRAVDKVVAQVSNLLYRSASSLRMPRQTRRDGHGNVLPIGNRRYSRLETCATPNWSDFVNSPAGQSRGFVNRPLEFLRHLSFVIPNAS